MGRSFIFAFLSLVVSLFAEQSHAVSREAWIEGFKREFPKMTCTENQIFRTLYKTTYEECISKMLAAAEHCIAQEMPNLPTDFESVDQGRQWGETIGKCAGAQFAQSVPLDPKGIFKMLPPGMTSGRVIGIAVGVALAFFLLIVLIVVWAVKQRHKP